MNYYEDDDIIDLRLSLTKACDQGDFNKVKELLTSTKLKDVIKINHNNYLLAACLSNNVDIVRYFFTSDTIKNYNDLGADSDYELLLSCNGNHLDVVKFLLESDDVENKPNIHYKDDLIFNNTLFRKQVELLEYLIFDLKIEKTEGIQRRLNNNKNDIEFNKQVAKWFEIRDLEKDLKDNLVSDNKNNTKIKL